MKWETQEQVCGEYVLVGDSRNVIAPIRFPPLATVNQYKFENQPNHMFSSLHQVQVRVNYYRSKKKKGEEFEITRRSRIIIFAGQRLARQI
jgi:hypothetical protein